jgi:dTDP-4-dehydrorhamnose reductase
MKIVICGSNGQLGSDCARVLGQSHEVYCPDREELDITKPSAVDRVLERIGPEIIINCAAFTQVDACETEKELAWEVNAEGPRNLGFAANRLGALLVHFSTDYVFSGNRRVPESYTEKSSPNPISYYGASKLGGEQAIRETIDSHMILRTAWMYGAKGHNFLKTILMKALNEPQKEIKVVNDQYGCPTWSFRLALQLEKLIKVRGRGTFHCTSQGYCTWFELATHFLEQLALPHRVVPCTTEEYPTPAKRPKNAILENRRLKDAGIHIMEDWKRDVDQFAVSFKEDLIKEARGLK